MTTKSKVKLLTIIGITLILSGFLGVQYITENVQKESEIVRNEPLGNSAFTAPSFFKISSSSVTLITSTRDFYIGGGTASSSSDVVFTVDPINDIVSVPSTASFELSHTLLPELRYLGP